MSLHVCEGRPPRVRVYARFTCGIFKAQLCARRRHSTNIPFPLNLWRPLENLGKRSLILHLSYFHIFLRVHTHIQTLSLSLSLSLAFILSFVLSVQVERPPHAMCTQMCIIFAVSDSDPATPVGSSPAPKTFSTRSLTIEFSIDERRGV